MSFRTTACCLAGVLSAVALGCRETSDRSVLVPAERIVLVSIDTLRADHLGSYGGPVETPALDGLARDGVRFTHAISPAPLTLPSHASLLTGLDPPRHGVRDNATFQLPDWIPTLTERLAAADFATAAFLGAMMLDRQFGLARGFGVYDDAMGRQDARQVYGIPERRAGEVVDAALAWLEQAPPRFFLWVHVFDPHAPWDPPGEPAEGTGRLELYAGEVAYTDAELGRLFEAIQARFGKAGTLIAVTADHGESLGEHGEGTHSLAVYDATQRVPLLLHGLGLPQGRVVDEVVRLVDVAPTLLGLAGLEPLPRIDGRDLLPLVYGEPDEPRVAYIETLAPQLAYGWSPLLGVRDARHKYIRAPRPELYDLEEDPGESENLAPTRVELSARLDAALEERVAGARISRFSVDPSDEDARLLEELGYVVPRRRWGEARLGVVGGDDPKDKRDVRRAMQEIVAAKIAGRNQEAIQKLSEIADEGFEVALFSAATALELGEGGAALRAAERAVELEPLSDDAHRVLGYAMLDQDRIDAADRAFATALNLNRERAGAWIGRGLVAERRGELDAAASHYQRASEVRGASSEALWYLAAVRIEQQRFEEAEALLAEFEPAALDMPGPAERLGIAEARAGRREQALARLDRALALSPENRPLTRARRRVDRGRYAP